MVLTTKPNISQQDIDEVTNLLKERNLTARVIRGTEDTIIAVIGDELKHVDFLEGIVAEKPYLVKFTPISSPYKPISRDAHPDYNGEEVNGSWLSKEIRAGPLVVGGNSPLAITAGPCSVPLDRILMREMGAMLQEFGVKALRGGGFKPRTSPYDFRGHGEEALALAREVADEYGLAFVTEPVEVDHIPIVLKYAHVLQIGTRNATQPFYRAVARATLISQTPILAKRGMSQYLEREFLPLVLNIYDYEPEKGNQNIMLCLRGIRTFDDGTRFTSDDGDVPVLKRKSILPVVGDPSHTAGDREYVVPHARGFIAQGVDGLIVEVYPAGKISLSDAGQAINYKQLEQIVKYARQVGRM